MTQINRKEILRLIKEFVPTEEINLMVKRNYSNKNLTIVYAYRKGFKSDKDGNLYSYTGAKLTPGVRDRNGVAYHRTTVYIGNRPDRISGQLDVHRLVAFQKFGHRMFDKDLEVRHLNGISTDNSWDNLELGTHAQNQMDKPKEVRVAAATKASKSRKNSFSEEKLKLINSLRTQGVSYKKIAEQVGCSKGTLSYYFGSGKYSKEQLTNK